MEKLVCKFVMETQLQIIYRKVSCCDAAQYIRTPIVHATPAPLFTLQLVANLAELFPLQNVYFDNFILKLFIRSFKQT